MFFALKRPRTLLFGLLLPSIAACSASNVSETRTVPSVPEPKVLREQVELDPSLNARLVRIRFFEGDRSKRALTDERLYETRFARAKTRTIYAEIHFEHPGPATKTYFPISLYFRQNGRTLRVEEFQARIEPNWTSSHHLVAAGHFEPGKWRAGDYEVDVYINSKKTATAYFEIY